jgi:hypothetical protein
VVDVLLVRLDLVVKAVKAVKAVLAVNKVQVQAALVRPVVPVQAQALPLHLPHKPAAPVQASRLWRFQAPTLA